MFSVLLKVSGSLFPLVAFSLLQTSLTEILISFKMNFLVSPGQAVYCLKQVSLIAFILLISKAFFPITSLTLLPHLPSSENYFCTNLQTKFLCPWKASEHSDNPPRGILVNCWWHQDRLAQYFSLLLWKDLLPFLQSLLTGCSSLQWLLVLPLLLAIFFLCQNRI